MTPTSDAAPGPCVLGFCIASYCDSVHHVDVTGHSWTEKTTPAPPTPAGD